jgi:hypothetical protein
MFDNTATRGLRKIHENPPSATGLFPLDVMVLWWMQPHFLDVFGKGLVGFIIVDSYYPVFHVHHGRLQYIPIMHSQEW